MVGGPALLQAYETGSGFLTMRGRVHIEDDTADALAATGSKGGGGGKKGGAGSKKKPAAAAASGSAADSRVRIVIVEMPYQTSKVRPG